MTDVRPQLGIQAEALIADTLDAREETIIKTTIAKLPDLSPQLALVAWMELAAGRTLRRTLIRRAEAENARRAQEM